MRTNCSVAKLIKIEINISRLLIFSTEYWTSRQIVVHSVQTWTFSEQSKQCSNLNILWTEYTMFQPEYTLNRVHSVQTWIYFKQSTHCSDLKILTEYTEFKPEYSLNRVHSVQTWTFSKQCTVFKPVLSLNREHSVQTWT